MTRRALVVMVSGWLLAASARAVEVDWLERRDLGNGVAAYSAELPVGPGEHDRIGLHRVVKESAPYHPVPTPSAVMLVHGDGWAFDATFAGFPAFLAANGVDVWGIDLRWTRVPADVVDFSFMSGWGMQTDLQDLRRAIAVARAVRLVTGSGAGRMHLLGFSRGGQLGYAYLSAEADRPPATRQVKGFIPVDIHFKTGVESVRQSACAGEAQQESLLASGNYRQDYRVVATFGELAAAAPEDPSPFFGPYTNRQLALDAGAFAWAGSRIPYLHSVAGEYDESGFYPLGLLYTAEGAWFDFLRGISPWQARGVLRDGEAILCNQTDVPFDDHLAEVTVPVLYVGAGGAYGEYGVYSTTLLGSTDVTTLVVNAVPPVSRAQDYGHDEPFLSEDAESVFWQPILGWIQSH